jgi:CheY-like chemotaxis protein
MVAKAAGGDLDPRPLELPQSHNSMIQFLAPAAELGEESYDAWVTPAGWAEMPHQTTNGGSAGDALPPVAERERTPSPRPTLLYVEDDRGYRESLTLRLGRLGYNVVEAGDGDEAVLRFLACDIDIVLTDVFMPRMDGVDLIRSLQSLRPDMPIVAYSGALESSKSGEATCGEAVLLLSKPVDIGQLAAALRRALGGTDGQA